MSTRWEDMDAALSSDDDDEDTAANEFVNTPIMIRMMIP